jgi:hypothetical protein
MSSRRSQSTSTATARWTTNSSPISGDPWHGPALDVLLANVTAEQAVAHSILGAHSIIELELQVLIGVGSPDCLAVHRDCDDLSEDDP